MWIYFCILACFLVSIGRADEPSITPTENLLVDGIPSIPVGDAAFEPKNARYFVFAKDKGGNEFAQSLVFIKAAA